jgi:hypothetical protein
MNIDQANVLRAIMTAEEKQRAERVAAWQEEEQRQREQACKIVNHHFRHPDIAYSFRPPSYWEIPGSPLELVLRNVKGTKRREMIRDFYEQGRLDQLVPVLAADELGDKDREGLGAIHPSFMGGEYLPSYLAMRSRSCESNSIRPRRMSSVYGPARSAASDRG